MTTDTTNTTHQTLNTGDFDYELPPEMIAQQPVEPRDSSRLLVLDRQASSIKHEVSFRAILDYLRPGDMLVANQSKVIPARIFGTKATGGQIELLLLRPAPQLGATTWEALVKPGRGTKPGAKLLFEGTTNPDEKLAATVVDTAPSGARYLNFDRAPLDFMEKYGQMPLPPYIHTQPTDPNRYQTVYATTSGSAAAPTAGLHFTPDLIQAIKGQGVGFEKVLLHVGLDTFRPVKEENALEHEMHSEWCQLSVEVAQRLNETRANGGRIFAVGTTTVRTLETAFDHTSNQFQPFSGETRLFLYPGKQLKAIDALITNFHLPRSTLLMLVSALAGRDLILQAYNEAVRERYRFFSFGDAMLIL
jgi:S-adenosylmethionine:tRNA ribosyltransferase-isomerase